jgi:hypothetical protein
MGHGTLRFELARPRGAEARAAEAGLFTWTESGRRRDAQRLGSLARLVRGYANPNRRERKRAHAQRAALVRAVGRAFATGAIGILIGLWLRRFLRANGAPVRRADAPAIPPALTVLGDIDFVVNASSGIFFRPSSPSRAPDE